ncbi:flagellar biosynthetic protein FlhF [Candidatus Magnetoovum chiemensis]|nr:flagellar biosynthetic protein FlhF [Candidatus Magnetoovum chiemensis]
MKIKKFQAKTFLEALAKVKEELSEDAIILSTEEKKGVNPFVEVTAAVDYDLNKSKTPYKNMSQSLMDLEKRLNIEDSVTLKEKPKKEKQETGLVKQTIEPETAQPKEIAKPVTVELKRIIEQMSSDIKGEIDNLRDTIEDMKNTGFEMSLPPRKRMLLYFLRERGIMEEYALLLCEKANDIDEIPALMLSNLKVKKRGTDLKAIMLIGPTGVGKTTTVAKLAANAIQEGKKAAIINLDTYRIGAVEQVRIYARILGIPLSVVATGQELKNTLARFSESKDVILIDTIGRNPRDGEYITDLSSVCDTDVPIETHLLMSSNSDDEFMIEAYKYYRKLPINYLAFTKVDEAVRYGSIYNMMLTYQKPVAYITTGQKVPRDIEFARVDKLLNLILKKGDS